MSGGKRAGAGRKKGIPNRASVKRQAAVASTGATPLEVMIRKMRFHLDTAERLEREAMKKPAASDEAGEKRKQTVAALDKAHEAAKDAAPYVHPRISAADGPSNLTIRINISEDDKRLL